MPSVSKMKKRTDYLYNNCDDIFRLTIPAARIATAKLLSKRYSMNQSEIARRLGIAQPAVSKYLKGRYTGKIRKLESMIERKGLAQKAARAAAANSRGVSARIDELASSAALVKAAALLL